MCRILENDELDRNCTTISGMIEMNNNVYKLVCQKSFASKYHLMMISLSCFSALDSAAFYFLNDLNT